MRSVGDHDHDLSCSESSDNSLVKRNGFNRPVKNLIVLSQILIVLSKISIVLSQILIVLFRISSFLLRIVLKMSKRFVSWKLNRNLANRLGSEPLFQHWPSILSGSGKNASGVQKLKLSVTCFRLGHVHTSIRSVFPQCSAVPFKSAAKPLVRMGAS